MGDAMSGCGCCGCSTIYTLDSTADWTLGAGATLSVTSETNGGVSYDWLTLSGEITPNSKFTNAYAESYLIDFVCRGTITVTIDGKDFTINGTSGTMTADATSIAIPTDANLSYPFRRVQIRATPTHTFISCGMQLDYGTVYTETNLVGSVLTVDRTADPSGDFSISGTGAILSSSSDSGDNIPLTVRSTAVFCDDGIYSDPTEVCAWTPMMPIPYLPYIDALKDDPATYFPLRYKSFDDYDALNDTYTPSYFLWPNMDDNDTLDPLANIVDVPPCLVTAEQIQLNFFSSYHFAKWREEHYSATVTTSLTGACTGGGTVVEPATIPIGALFQRSAQSEIGQGSGTAGQTTFDSLMFRGYGFAGLSEWTAKNSGVVTQQWYPWPFSTSIASPEIPYLQVFYDLESTTGDVNDSDNRYHGGCTNPYPKPTFKITAFAGSTSVLQDSFEVPVNSIASGMTASISAGGGYGAYDYSF